MGDPICKWRTASVETAVELVKQLPKREMSEDDFWEKMEDCLYGAAFRKTAYQLATQMGLYYIDESGYHPRFDHNISLKEAEDYLKKWVTRYYVPNPYTARRFDKMDHSLILLYAVADFCKQYPHLSNLQTACDSLFGETTGNLGSVKMMLKTYSGFMDIDSNYDIHLKPYKPVDPDVYVHRYDKKAFFEAFD